MAGSPGLPGLFYPGKTLHGLRTHWQDSQAQSSMGHQHSSFIFFVKSFPILPLNDCSFLKDMFLRNLHKLNFISSYDEAFIAKHGCECCLAQPQLKTALELQFNGESLQK